MAKPKRKPAKKQSELAYWRVRAGVAERRCRDINDDRAGEQVEHLRLLDALETIVDAVAKHKECPF